MSDLAASLDPHPPTPSKQTAAGLAVRDLWFGYDPNQPVLRSLSLEAGRGELLMILGTSGSGKSTLLKLVKGLLRPQAGEISLMGSPSSRGIRSGHLDASVAYIPQQLGLVRNRTVLDNALMGALGRVPTWRGLTGFYPSETRQRAVEVLGELGIGHKAGEKVRSLSGGERQRVAIARALVQSPSILVADEFVSQLDPVTTAEIMALVRRVAATGVTVVMTTHELDVVQRFADRVAVVRDGTCVLASEARAVDENILAGALK